jgi:hypothetical protein
MAMQLQGYSIEKKSIYYHQNKRILCIYNIEI